MLKSQTVQTVLCLLQTFWANFDNLRSEQYFLIYQDDFEIIKNVDRTITTIETEILNPSYPVKVA